MQLPCTDAKPIGAKAANHCGLSPECDFDEEKEADVDSQERSVQAHLNSGKGLANQVKAHLPHPL